MVLPLRWEELVEAEGSDLQLVFNSMTKQIQSLLTQRDAHLEVPEDWSSHCIPNEILVSKLYIDDHVTKCFSSKNVHHQSVSELLNSDFTSFISFGCTIFQRNVFINSEFWKSGLCGVTKGTDISSGLVIRPLARCWVHPPLALVFAGFTG